MQYTLQDSLEIAATQKKAYQEKLMGQYFAYAYIDRKHNRILIKEVEFQKKHFLHLTGLDYKNALYSKRVLGITVRTNAEDFFDRLGTDNTLIQDVSFIQGRNAQETVQNFNHAQDKLRNLPQITNIAKKAVLIGAYKDSTQFDLVINRNKENLIFIQEKEYYIPVSSRYGKSNNFFDKHDTYDVLAIFSKKRIGNKYKIEYLNKNIQLSAVYRFDTSILSKFDYKSFDVPAGKVNFEQQQKLINIFYSSIKANILSQLNAIGKIREKAFISETDMNEYINATKIFRQGIENEETYKIAKELLTAEKEQCSSEDSIDLITEEIEKLESKFSPASGNIHIMKFESPEKKLPVNQDMSAAIPLNRNSPSLWGEIKKGVSSLISGFKRSFLPPPPPKTYRSISKPQKAAPALPKKDSSHDKNVEKSENKPKQEARFSLSDLNNSKYAPRSHTQDKGIEHKNHIDR